LSLLLNILFLFFSKEVFTQASVLTQHNNINRTGWYQFLLDTGSELTMMTSAGLARAGLPSSNKLFPKKVYGIGKSQAEWELFKALLDHHPVRLQDAKGTALGFSGGGASYGPDEVRITNNVRCEPLGGGGKAAGEPVTLVWEFPSEVEQVSVPLEFRDVPLP